MVRDTTTQTGARVGSTRLKTDGGRRGLIGPQGAVILVIGFWAVWFTFVFLTNFFEGLVQLDILGEGWSFASGNYPFLEDVMGVHDTPGIIVSLVFTLGVVWELAVAAAMWWTVVGYYSGTAPKDRMYLAFLLAVGFFAGFLVLTEIFIAYGLADTHVRLFIAALVSMYVVDRWWA